MAGETATAMDGTHPTGMHSCSNIIINRITLLHRSSFIGRSLRRALLLPKIFSIWQNRMLAPPGGSVPPTTGNPGSNPLSFHQVAVAV